MDATNAAWGEWLDTFQWDAWATFTFDNRFTRITAQAALRAFERMRAFAAERGADLSYFVGTEIGGQGDRLHLHALLGGMERVGAVRAQDPHPVLRRSDLWEWWFRRYGRAQILPYERERGAAFYVSKYVTKSLTEWDICHPIPAVSVTGISAEKPSSAA